MSSKPLDCSDIDQYLGKPLESSPGDRLAFSRWLFSGRVSTPAFVGLFTDEVAHLQPRVRLGAYPISCRGTIVEGVDALKGAIRPLSLDCPLIAVNEDNVKDRLLRALGHPDAIPHKNDSLETIR